MTPYGINREASPQHWLQLIRNARDWDGFVVYAEPIVDVATGAPVRHELALRLPDADGQLLAPASFMPTAERFGFTPELDGLLLGRAVGLARQGHAVAIDIAAASLTDPDLARRIELTVHDAQIDPALLTLELTEEALTTNAKAAAAFVQRIHALGCSITVDHFGSGSAGFGYLKRLPVDRLKIDAGFVSGLGSSSPNRHIVRAFVELAQGLGMSCAADGVRDAPAQALLEDVEVEEAQGPFFGVPAPLPISGGVLLPVHRGGHDGP